MTSANSQCSTPFGINEGITPDLIEPCILAGSAERLSASTKESRLGVVAEAVPPRVLNAFRHQRRNHSSVDCSRPNLSSAQRLSASTKESRESSCLKNSVPTCAQRLSASTKDSPRVINYSDGCTWCSTPFGINEGITMDEIEIAGDVCVLNAFRHQRRNHIESKCRSGQSSVVLNAFRHQRRNHQMPAHHPLTARTCSTPFGINEGIT